MRTLMNARNRAHALALPAIVAASALSSACTGQLPGSFRLGQQVQTFSSQQEINTKIDLLWVIDNSASMDVSQQKLRAGFSGFARKYMQPTWDIRVGVITSDTFMANPAFASYRTRVISGSVNYQSSYIYNRRDTWVNPAWNPNLVDLNNGRFPGGIKYGDLNPAWGPNYARLLPGMHDGPVVTLCMELMPFFYRGITQCAIRDDQTRYNGPSHCINPDTGAGETSLTQCVNTVQNDTIRSGRPIISTMPPAGVAGDSAWVDQLIRDFMVNATTGSSGQGSERGLGSLLQFLGDNEISNTAFFRKDSLRGIIFVSDEEDQSMEIPALPTADFSPQSHYQCDQAGLTARNGATAVTGNNGYCCSDPTKNCAYGAEGTSCPAKTVDGHTYTVSLCPRADKLIPVADVKTRLDEFFLALDEKAADADALEANYFITSIVALDGAAIQSLQAARTANYTALGMMKTIDVDRADRYLELGNLVGNGSLAMNIADDDYAPILDAIGRAIIAKKSTFTLTRAPTGVEDMIVLVIHADGSKTTIPASKYQIQGKSLIVTDSDLILSLAATDKISIDYQPKTVF